VKFCQQALRFFASYASWREIASRKAALNAEQIEVDNFSHRMLEVLIVSVFSADDFF
jgi:hypothetical protein